MKTAVLFVAIMALKTESARFEKFQSSMVDESAWTLIEAVEKMT